MPKKKKKPILVQFFNGLAWLVKQLAKGIWFLLKAIGKGIAAGTKQSAKSIKHAQEERKRKASLPKVDAAYKQLTVKHHAKGDFDDFSHRLLKDSLIVAIAGRRGSGKSATGFRLLENAVAHNRPAFVLGVKDALPAWIHPVEQLSDVKNNGVVLVDEGAISFSSRSSMKKENKDLSSLLAIARHKNLTLLFITQNTGMIDKNVLNLCDVILLKEGSLLQQKMERSVMKDFYATADKELKKVPASSRKSHCYVFDADFEGLVKTDLPTFWSDKVSKNQA